MLDFLSIYKIYKKVVQFIIGPIFVVEDCELFYWVQISKIWWTFCPSLDASLLKAGSLFISHIFEMVAGRKQSSHNLAIFSELMSAF